MSRAPRPGTNLALANALLKQLIANDWIDPDFIDQHTKGFDALASVVANYKPSRVAEISGIAARDLEAAAEIFGTSSAAVSTVLQGFYQSHGAAVTSTEHAALRFDGRARLQAAEWMPPPETPDELYPMSLMTGRTVYHFHTRTKTGRAPELNAAAPEPWVELALSDAADLDLSDGDPVRVESRRGAVEVAVRCTGNRPGTLFLPFHYGDPDTAANDLTPTSWDPVSKQPHFKSGAGRVVRQVSDDASVLISGSVGDRLRDPRALLPAGRRGSSGRG